MKNWWRWSILMALYLPLIAIPAIRPSDGKELRPSDHGLPNQGDGDQAKAPQMSSFFGNGASSTTTTQPLPEAQNFTDPSWSTAGRGGGGGADRVKKVLIVSSLVCGIAGIVLLVAAGILFLHRFRNRRSATR